MNSVGLRGPGGSLNTPLDLIRLIGAEERRMGEELFRQRDLTVEQGRTLIYLAQNPGAKQRDIADMSCRGAPSVSSLVQGLERRHLLERRSEPGDDRSKRVYVTPTGLDLIAGLETSMAEEIANILAPLTAPEQRVLQKLLEKVARKVWETTAHR